MSTQDVIKKSVLDNFKLSEELSIQTVLLTLGLAFVFGLIIYWVYKRTFSGVMFSKNFAASLIMITMVTTMIILPITTNVVLSLGAVGALSIVRFRTAVKEPTDTIFMFWGIATGLTLGARLYSVAAIGVLVISAFMLLLSLFKFKKERPYLLILSFESHAKDEVQSMLRKLPQGNLKSKTVSNGVIELTIEMSVKESDFGVVETLAGVDGVQDASLISYAGDVVG
jgi:hypothetical protein